MMAREVTYIKQDKPEGENLPAFLRYNKSLGVVSVAHISDTMCKSGSTATVASVTLAPGSYIVTANVAWGTSSAADRRDLYMTAGAYNDAKLAYDTRLAVGAYSTGISISAVVKVTAATTVRLYATQRSGSDLAILAGDVLTAVKVSG